MKTKKTKAPLAVRSIINEKRGLSGDIVELRPWDARALALELLNIIAESIDGLGLTRIERKPKATKKEKR